MSTFARVGKRIVLYSTTISIGLLSLIYTVQGEHRTFTGAPPTAPPHDLLSAYTLNSTIPLQYYYVDDSLGGNGTHIKFKHEEIVEMIDSVGKFVDGAHDAGLPSPPSVITNTFWLTQLRDMWLVKALEAHPIAGLHVAVFGSTSPWYESMLLHLGAQDIVVYEYNRLTYDHPSITTVHITVTDTDSCTTNDAATFDAALSISRIHTTLLSESLVSFDHDGLGRYGDALNPDGDIDAMKTVSCLLKKDGLLFLTVPVGPDVIVWNLHRRYGRLRLPLLLKSWTTVAKYGWSETLLDKPAPFTAQYEPVFVLKQS